VRLRQATGGNRRDIRTLLGVLLLITLQLWLQLVLHCGSKLCVRLPVRLHGADSRRSGSRAGRLVRPGMYACVGRPAAILLYNDMILYLSNRAAMSVSRKHKRARWQPRPRPCCKLSIHKVQLRRSVDEGCCRPILPPGSTQSAAGWRNTGAAAVRICPGCSSLHDWIDAPPLVSAVDLACDT